MPRGGANRKPTAARRQYFELVRQGLKGAAAARQVGVSTSCGSKWFIEAGSMIIPDVSISPRFLTQDDRIAIADGLRAGKLPAAIAAAIGKSTSTVYREIARGKKDDGSYDPWWAQNQALLRRQRPKTEKIRDHAPLRNVVREKIDEKWSPQQISRYLRRQYPDEPQMHACAETIYRGLFAGLLGRRQGRLRTGRTRRKKQRRGVPSPNKIKNMTLIRDRPAIVNERSRPSTNAIESVNARIRKAVRARGHFPNEAAALKCVYMALMSLDPTGKGRKRWTMRWKAPLNAFQIAFEGRLTPANN